MLSAKVKKWILTIYFVLILILSGFSILPGFNGNNLSNRCGTPIHTPTARSAIIVDVNGNGAYTTIQAAIDNASTGTTIEVWDGTYHEDIIVNKTVSLIGNGTENTIINGSQSIDVVRVTANWVNISGFSMRNSSLIGGGRGGILLTGNHHCKITDSKCYDNKNGIVMINSNWNTIMDCNFSNNDGGMRLSNANFNSLINNECSDNLMNIYLYGSDNNQLDNNICQNSSTDGIIIDESDGNTISNSTCEFNTDGGIYLGDSNDNVLFNNTCSNNKHGIYVSQSEDNKIRNNNCNKNTDTGIYNWYSDLNEISDNTCVSNGDRGIHLSQAEDITVVDNNCQNNKIGINVVSSDDSTFINNDCSNQRYGISLDRSWNNDLVNNECNSNIKDGISLNESHRNSLSDNTCNDNDQDGILIYDSKDNNLSKNTCLRNTAGIHVVEDSEYNVLEYNDCSNNTWGIYTRKSYLNTIKNNTCFDNNNGIYLIFRSEANLLENNICEFNDNSGIALSVSANNTLANNLCSFNFASGISIEESDVNTIVNNTCIDTGSGIYMAWASTLNTIKKNICSDNLNGIVIIDAMFNTVANNTCLNNSIGISVLESQYNEIVGNNNSENQKGIFLRNAGSNTFSKNICSSNNGYGIFFYEANTENVIFKNDICFNQNYGILASTLSTDNNIYFNNFINNTYQAADNGLNKWNNENGLGNYWSDYTGLDNGANGRTAADGVGDTNIPHMGLDSYPFMIPYGWVAPVAPFLVDPGTINRNGNFVVSWITYQTVDGFILQEDDNIGFTSPKVIYYGTDGSAFQFAISGHVEGMFCYRIKSYYDIYQSGWSNIVNITINYGPGVPENLEVLPWPEGNTLEISWDPNDDVDDDTVYYELQIRSVGDWSALAIIYHPDSTYNDTGRIDGVEYSYRVQAVENLDRTSGWCSPVKGTPQDIMAPSPPWGLKIVNRTYYSISIEWSMNRLDEVDVSGYNVYQSLKSNTTDWGEPLNCQFPVKDKKYEDTNLQEGTTYYYVVTAVDEVPNESEFSQVFQAPTYLFTEYPQPPIIKKPLQDLSIPEDTYDDRSINMYNWFSDVNGDDLSFRCVGQNHIVVNISQQNGTVVLSPDRDWNGQELLTFYAFDGLSEISDDVLIVIVPVDDAPIDAAIITPEHGLKIKHNTPLSFEGNCTDADLPYGDVLTYTWSSDRDSVLGTGKTLSDIKLSSGQHQVTLIVLDSKELNDTAMINITVAKAPAEVENNANLGLLATGAVIIILVAIIFLMFLVDRQKAQVGKEEPNKIESVSDHKPKSRKSVRAVGFISKYITSKPKEHSKDKRSKSRRSKQKRKKRRG